MRKPKFSIGDYVSDQRHLMPGLVTSAQYHWTQGDAASGFWTYAVRRNGRKGYFYRHCGEEDLTLYRAKEGK